jgi:pyroglutamyl-peptidase
MKLILTGFGKFAGVDKNPTEEAVNCLSDDIGAECSVQFSKRVLKVSVGAVRELIEDLHSSGEIEDTVIVHLGVDSNASRIKLERQAYNNMTFRVPDEDGDSPDGQKIADDAPFEHPLTTCINVRNG